MPPIPECKSSETESLPDCGEGKVCAKCKQWKGATEYGITYYKRQEKYVFQAYCNKCASLHNRRRCESGHVSKLTEALIDDGYNYRYIVKKLRDIKKSALKLGYAHCTAFASDLATTFTTICKVCNKDVGRSGISLDHCHTTGNFRGWICKECNRALGATQDSIKRLKLLISYLEEHADASRPD